MFIGQIYEDSIICQSQNQKRFKQKSLQKEGFYKDF